MSLLEKRRQLLEQEKEKELTELRIQSMIARMEYENTLLKESLETSRKEYEQLNKELKDILNETQKKIKDLKTSNEILKENMKSVLESLNKEYGYVVSNWNAKAMEAITSIKVNLESLLMDKIEDLSLKTTEYIEQTEKLKKDAQKRYEGFYGRKKWIDSMIYINFAITPILLIIILYLLFFKK